MRDDEQYTKNAEEAECRSVRNRFFRGRLMKADDFENEQRYHIERRRLGTRAVWGWGVAVGLPVRGPRRPSQGADSAQQEGSAPSHDAEPAQGMTQQAKGEIDPETSDPGRLAVGRGLAFDRHGRDIALVDEVRLGASNTFVIEEGGKVRGLDKLAAGDYLLSIHYAEKHFGDANLLDSCGCDGPQNMYTCETAVFSLRPLEGHCPCGQQPCRRRCRCGTRTKCSGVGRGPHACLCRSVTDAQLDPAPGTLCEWRNYRIDPSDPVPLACVAVEIKEDRCGPELVGWVENECDPRRLVKSNELLYDLLRGCDLTQIEWISWSDWHRSDDQVPWDSFERMFSSDGSTDFAARFSGPVVAETIERDVVTMWAVTTDQSTGWRTARRIPIVGVDVTPDPAHTYGYATLPPGTTNQLRVKVRREWVLDEIERGRESWLSGRDFRIEIEIHGDFVLDCHGQAVDANAVGRRATPTGNGTPGGTFRSNFRVQRKRRDDSAYDVA